MDVILERFSARLKALRKEKKSKQKEMAEFLDCTVRHYQKIEYGKVNVPALTLIALSDYFGVTTNYLLGRSDKR